MRKLLLRWLCLTLAILIAAMISSAVGLPFSAEIKTAADFLELLLGAALLAIINATLGRVLKFLTAPLNCLTLGLVSLLINAGLLMWVGSMDIGFKVGSFLAALLGSVLISASNGVLGGILIRDKERGED